MRVAHIHVSDKDNKGDHAIVIAVQELIHKYLQPEEIIDIPVYHLKSADNDSLKQINETDLVVIGGGGIYYRYFLPFDKDFISQIKPPIAIVGVGHINEFGAPPLESENAESVKYLNEVAALTSVRDVNTQNFLIDLGIPESKVNLIGDPAVFLSEPAINSDPKEKLRVGFNLNYSGWLDFGKYESQILSSYSETMKHLSDKYNAEIYYAKHHPGEDDIIPKLDYQDYKIVDLFPNEQKSMYATFDLLIGMMLHSVVLAFGAGVPEINVAYDIRNVAFADFIGKPELIIKPEDLTPEALIEKTEHVLSNQEQYKNDFASKKADMENVTKDFFKQIESLLN